MLARREIDTAVSPFAFSIPLPPNVDLSQPIRYHREAPPLFSPGLRPGVGRQPLKLGTVKYPHTIPRDEAAARELKKRTLINLDDQRPAWLDLAHRRLDEAAFAAYG